jgi:hypothetical protein
MILLYAISAFVIVLAANVVYDYRKWLRNQGVRHKKDFIIRCILLVPSLYLFAKALPVTWVWSLIISGAMMGFVFWFLFDGLYNVIRGYKFFETGSIDKDESTTDNTQRFLGKFASILIKIIFSIATVTIYVILFTR